MKVTCYLSNHLVFCFHGGKMYSKFKILKFGHVSLTSIEINRLLKFRSFVFHFLTLLWHVYLTYHTTVGAITILLYRKDLVDKTFGLGAQYITVWNQVSSRKKIFVGKMETIKEKRVMVVWKPYT